MDNRIEVRLGAAAKKSIQRAFENCGLGSARDEIYLAYALWREAHGEYLDIMAAHKVEEAMKGPYTHKYKGVPVTKDQFVRLMNAEGFMWPQDDAPAAAPTQDVDA